MIVHHRPLTADLLRQLVALSATDWHREAAWEFFGARGWTESEWQGVDTDSGHRLVADDPDWSDTAQRGFHLPFAFIGEEEVELPDWEAGEGRDAFDAAWREACAAVTAELGAAQLVLPVDGQPWQLAAWRVEEAVALVVAQSEEFTSYGELDMAAVWLIRHPEEAEWPDSASCYDWLLGEG